MSAFEDNLPQSSTELVQQSKTDVQRELSKVDNEAAVNAFLEGNWLSAIPTADANRIFDFYLQLVEAKRQNFPDTAEGENADEWGAIYIGSKNAATGATGLLAISGTAGSTVTTASDYQSSDGISYSVTTGATISDQVLSVALLEGVGTLATAKTASPHLFSSFIQVTIAGADQAEFNGTFDIQVTSEDEFTYTLPTTATATPATGTITASFTSASLTLQADVPSDPDAPFGADTNLSLDTPLTIQVPISGVNDTGNVGFGGLAGGADEESEDDYKNRYLDKIRNPVAHFNESDIDQQIRDEVEGVTRTFIQRAGFSVGTIAITSITRDGIYATVTTTAAHGLFTGAKVSITGAAETEYNVTDAEILLISDIVFAYVVLGSPSTPAGGTPVATGVIALGHVQIYFTRDNDQDPIPSAPEVQEVLESVLEITPVNTPESFVLVDPPVANPIPFNFTDLDPPTQTMRDAVDASLAQFFEEQTNVGEGIDEDAYRSAIFNTVDTETGDTVNSFTLSTPIGDIPGEATKLPTLGVVSFP